MGKNSDTKDRYKRQDVCGHRYPFFFFFKSDILWPTCSLVWEVRLWMVERRAGSTPGAGVCVCKGVGVCVHSCRNGECVCLCSGDSGSLALWP